MISEIKIAMNKLTVRHTRKSSTTIHRSIKIMAFAVIFISYTVTANNGANVSTVPDNQWRPAKQKNGITSYTRNVALSKYKAVKGETTLPVSTARLFAAINDASACPEWADTCKESYIQQEISAHEFFIYTLNDLPWPVMDRDVVAHVSWSLEEDGTVMMRSKAVNNVATNEIALNESVKNNVPLNKGVVRIEMATAQWRFKPLTNNSTAASFEIHMDPNGSIPGWLLNRLILNSPFSTFDNLAKQAAKDKYADAVLPF